MRMNEKKAQPHNILLPSFSFIENVRRSPRFQKYNVLYAM